MSSETATREDTGLAERAARFEQDVEERLLDAHGLVLSALNSDTMQPFVPGYFADKHIHHFPGETFTDFSEYMPYENVGMCSGAYLAAMVWKYRATHDPVALARARRTFTAIRYLFELSQEYGEGFICKCYGGRLSDQTSSDQYLYTMTGLDLFQEVGTAAERSCCTEMIGKMVRWWIRKKYSYPYFGQPLAWQPVRFPAFSWLAWQHTGDDVFRTEFERLCALPAVQQQLPYAQMNWEAILQDARTRQPAFEFEENSGNRLIRLCPETTESGFLSLEPMLRYDAPHRSLWLEKTRQLIDLGRRGIAADGYALAPHLYNMRTGALTEVREVLSTGEGYNGWRFLRFVGWIRSGMWPAMFARAAVGIHHYLPEVGALDLARRILSQLDRSKLRWFVDMDGQQFPPDMKWMDQVYSGDAVTHWLWAYWEACATYGSEWGDSAKSGPGGHRRPSGQVRKPSPAPRA